MNSNTSNNISTMSSSSMGSRKYMNILKWVIWNSKLYFILVVSGLGYLWVQGEAEEDLFDNIELEDPLISVNETQ